MKVTKLESNGKLHKDFLPAIYFDTSVLIDYWMTESMEVSETEIEELFKKNEPSHLPIVREILKSERRIEKMIEIRKKLLSKIKVTPIVSPLSLLELMEWHAESAFKQIASEASGVIFIQKKNKKQIGDYLKKGIEMKKAEDKVQKGKKEAFERLMSETWLNGSFAEAHGLQGLLQVDIVNFNLTITNVWEEPSAYAYLQLGVADIMHVLLAQHFGCEYIASFDSDFERVKEIIKEETGIIVLTSPEEILSIL